MGHFQAGDRIEVTYPLLEDQERSRHRQSGFPAVALQVTWKGDTVIRMQPVENEVRTGYSDFDQREVEVFYGQDGPGPLYQREHWLKSLPLSETPLHPDGGGLDFWKIQA
jgi:hypothetical protein